MPPARRSRSAQSATASSTAFLQAGVCSFAAIVVLLAVALRRVRDVVLTMVPVLLSGLLTFATSPSSTCR